MEEKNGDKEDYKLVTQHEEHIRMVLEESELNRKPPKHNEQHYEDLDSSMKKNTSFVKKIKGFNEANLSSLLQDVELLNLNNYLEEIAMGLFECKFKMTSVPYMALVLGKIHRNYSQFGLMLHTIIKEKLLNMVFEIKKLSNCRPNDNGENQITNKELQNLQSNLILIFYLFCELFLYEIIPTKKHNEFSTVVREVLTLLFENVNNYNITYLALLVQLFKYIGIDYLGISPRKLQHALKEKSTSSSDSKSYSFDIIDYKLKQWIKEEVLKCFDIFSDYYIEKSEELYIAEQTNNQTIGLRGALSQEKKDAFEQLQNLHKKLKKNIDVLADIVDKDSPLFEIKTANVSVVLDRLGENIDVVLPEKDTEAFNLLLWDGAEIRSFYTDLPCVKFKNTVVQNISYFDYKQKMTQKRLKIIKENIHKYKNDLEFDENDTDLLDYQKRNISCVNENEISNHMMNYITQLQQLVNRDLIDNAAIEFLKSLFNKKNQKILIEVLHGRTRYIQLRLGLLPFFSRLIAIISQVFPELGYEIVNLLYRDIRYHIKKKNHNNLEYKQRLVKYIGELTLFGICPKLETINLAKVFLADFYGHNIDMLCTLLDSCGRYLFVNHDSHQYTKQLMEIIIRKVKFSMMDKWHISQLENICLACNPVAALNYKNMKARKAKDPLLSYIKFILYTTLSRKTSHQNFQTLLQLPFQHYQVYWYVVKCFSRPWKFKFSLIDVVVSMITALNSRKKPLVNAIIDRTLETMAIFMESCDFHYNQNLLCIVVYLGEFFNFGLLDFNTLIQILYFVVSHKFTLDNFQYKCVDPDHNLIRIRMVCELIKTVFPTIDLSDDFQKNSFAKFLLFFQCYYWDKKLSDIYNGNRLCFPHSIDMIMEETFHFINYFTPFYDCAEEAKFAFEQQFNTVIDNSTCVIQQSTVSSMNAGGMFLNTTINEDDDGRGDLNPESFMELEYERLIHDRYNNHEINRYKKSNAISIPYAVLATSSSSSRESSENELIPEQINTSMISRAQYNVVTHDMCSSKDLKVKFVVRKNKKPVSKEVVIPGNSFLAADIQHRKQVEKKEMKHIKSIVLNLEKLQTDDNRNINELYRTKK